MADSLLAVSDLLADAFDLAPFEVADVLTAVPFLNLLPMVPSSNGTTHKYPKLTTLPTVAFRADNAGRDLSKTATTIITDTLKNLDFTWEADFAVANGWRKGRQHFVAREGLWHVLAALKMFEVQVINGTLGTGSAAGFSGLRNLTTVDSLADTMVVNAAGTTAATASSVWAVRVGETGVCGVFKGEGSAVELGETTVVQRIVNPGTDNKTFPAYYTPGSIWLGMQEGGVYDVARICNITADSGNGLTDLLMSQLLEKFPVGFGPTHFVMSRRSRGQLQRSRTTYSPTGMPAPIPEEYQGIPIVTTDSQSDTEALVT